MPLYQFLGGAKRALVTDETIYINTPERMVDDALRIQEKGAEAIKVKLGTNLHDDIDRIAAIRKAIGDKTPIRTDANQGWDVVTASGVLRAIGDWNVQYCEQPIKRHDIAGLRQIRRNTTVPIMADESLFDATDAIRLVREEAVDYFNIKLSKSGGIFEALKINAIAEAAGIPCMIGCMSESRLALTANAHFAAARQNVRFCDLDGCFEHAEDPVYGGITYHGYQIELPDAPGIGAEVDSSISGKSGAHYDYMTITTVQSEADVQGILDLQQANLRKNVPVDVQLAQGFVTVEHDPAVLMRMNQAAPSIIAKDGDKVVGYALTMLPEFGADVPELLPLFSLINSLSYADQPLSSHAYYVMGQVCVADGYRGQQIFDRMFKHHREVYGDRFRLLITDISANNTRSLRAHARVGFQELHSFHDSTIGETW